MTLLKDEGHPKSFGQWMRKGYRGWPNFKWDEDNFNDLDYYESESERLDSIQMQSWPSQEKHLKRLRNVIGKKFLTKVIGNNEVVIIGEGEQVELGKGNPQGNRLAEFSGKARAV